jgi:hypothetical protein
MSWRGFAAKNGWQAACQHARVHAKWNKSKESMRAAATYAHSLALGKAVNFRQLNFFLNVSKFLK